MQCEQGCQSACFNVRIAFFLKNVASADNQYIAILRIVYFGTNVGRKSKRSSRSTRREQREYETIKGDCSLSRLICLLYRPPENTPVLTRSYEVLSSSMHVNESNKRAQQTHYWQHTAYTSVHVRHIYSTSIGDVHRDSELEREKEVEPEAGSRSLLIRRNPYPLSPTMI